MKPLISILHLEDDAADAELVRALLEEAGLACRINHVQTGEEFREALCQDGYDLILADYRLPGYDGMSALRQVQEMQLQVPFIFISGTMGEDSAIEGLREGATDYVLKHKLSRLVPAVRRALAEAENRRERRRAEAALRQSEENYRLLVKQIPAVVFKGYGDGSVDFFDDKIEALTGYPKEEFDSRRLKWLDLIIPEDQPGARDRIIAALKTSRSYEREYRIRKKSGEIAWIQGMAQIFVDAAGQLDFTSGVILDITARKQTDEALRRSEKRKTILNQIANVFLTVSDDEMYAEVLAVVLQVMKSKFGMFGFIGANGDLVMPSMSRGVWSECQVPDKSFCFPPATWGESLWGRAIREKKAYFSDGPFQTPKGHISLDRFLAVPIVFGDVTIGLVAVANSDQSYTAEDQDLLESVANYISPILNARLQRDWQEQERKQAEAAVMQLSRQMELILNSAGEGIFGVDTEGKVTFVNPAMAQMLGWEIPELLGRSAHDLSHHTRPDGQPYPLEECPIYLAFKHGRTYHADDEFFWRKDGTSFPVEYTSTPIREGGRLVGTVVVIKDINERRQAEAAQLQFEAQLRQAQKMEAIGTLAGGIAHDFNNILVAIIGYAELSLMEMDQEPDLQEVSKCLEGVLQAGKRAKDLAQQILTFSRKQEQEIQPVQLDLIIKETLKLLRATVPSTIEIRFSLDLESGVILADPTQIHQVVMNLCTNAYQAMREQGGLLEVSLEAVEVDAGLAKTQPDLHAGSYLRLSVRDNGPGIEPGVLKRIFEPYFTTKEPGEGTGLGLAVVHGIVLGLGGAILVESQVGSGTTFQVYFPRLDHRLDEQLVTVESLARYKGKEHILFIDDEPQIVQVIQHLLQRLGYRVSGSTSSAEALALFRARPDSFDLVITDQTMPQITGIQLAKEILDLRPEQPIILCTGFSEAVSGEKVRELGVREYLLKPFYIGDLAKTIHRVFHPEETG
jgi:PAS domain S-box-containing protein